MYRHSRFAGILGCVIALAMAGCATNSGIAPPTGSATQPQSRGGISFDAGWVQKDGIRYHVPHYMATVRQAARRVRSDILLVYYGGPVQLAPTVCLTTSGHNNIETQYYQISGGQTQYITNPSNQNCGTWDDETNAVPRHPSDSQIAAEALRAVSHFGYNANASYVVATPHGRSTSGFGTQWCAYHSATSTGGKLVAYTDLPYMPDAGGNCGANFISPPSDESGADEGVTIVEGHELGETVTDPNPPSGWYNYSQGEIGDICAWQNIQNDPFGSFSYTMQPMFSNATQSCVHSY
jgi:hypothetical protein